MGGKIVYGRGEDSVCVGFVCFLSDFVVLLEKKNEGTQVTFPPLSRRYLLRQYLRLLCGTFCAKKIAGTSRKSGQRRCSCSKGSTRDSGDRDVLSATCGSIACDLSRRGTHSQAVAGTTEVKPACSAVVIWR